MNDASKTHIIISKNLKFLRKYNKISQVDLATELDLTRNKIASYESKNIEPNLKNLVGLADYFNICIDDLVREEINADNIMSLMDKKKLGIERTRKISINFDLDKKKALEHFIEENQKIKKIISGVSAFYSINHAEMSLDAKQIFSLIDFLSDTNQKLIVDVFSTNN
jgi:transcriptional regulator with XRE-family HTH domain